MSTKTSHFERYDTSDTPKAELENNLTLVNEIVRMRNLKGKPEFYILGGAALIFHALNYDVTLDIDTANRIESSIKDEVSPFIDDAASEVVDLGTNYRTRLVPYREDLDCIKVYLLSLEDLLITKLISARRKDLVSSRDSGILDRVNFELLTKILMEEYDAKSQELVKQGLKIIGRPIHTD